VVAKFFALLLLFAAAAPAVADNSLPVGAPPGRGDLRCSNCKLQSAQPIHFDRPVTFQRADGTSFEAHDVVLLHLAHEYGSSGWVYQNGVGSHTLLWSSGELVPRLDGPGVIWVQPIWSLQIPSPPFAELPARAYAQLPAQRATHDEQEEVSPAWIAE
jgi:hypothetical protein